MQTYSRAFSFRRAPATIRPFFRSLVFAILATALPLPVLAENTIVRMEINFGTTPAGNIDIELYDDEAPVTVTNFLRYAGGGNYNGTIIHRSVPGIVLQGGGYIPVNFFGQLNYFHVPEFPPIQNEFSPSRSNLRGTIAMAKIPATDPQGNPVPGGGPDSATSEWFFNLDDNGGSPDTNPQGFDYQNGGFTVFGRVLDPGMDFVVTIANIPTWNATSVFWAFSDIPLYNYSAGSSIQLRNLVTVNRVPNVKTTGTIWGTLAVFSADVDMAFGKAGALNAADTESLLSKFTPPPDTSAYHMSGVLNFEIAGTMDQAGEVIVLRHGGATNPNRYYAYGPTPDNRRNHWYDFSFDGETGAEIAGAKIRLHFVDGQRGDHDLTVNNSISHQGAPTQLTDINTEKLSGCTIAASPSTATRHGDWILVAMFLALLGLARKRAHH
jgi:cyclophilin family peptidyl-prolyl cis-trans isomerase